MLYNNQTRIRGYVPPKIKPIEPNGRDLVQNVLDISSLIRELQALKSDITAFYESMKESGDRSVKETESKISELSKVIDKTIEKVKTLPQTIKGQDGKDAEPVDTEEIIKRVLEKIKIPEPQKIDETKLINRIIAKIPENKASLKIIQEKFETDPMSVIDKILELADKGKLKLKTSHIDGLEQTISAFRNQITTKGYLHGGGDTVMYTDLTNQIDGMTNVYTIPRNNKLTQINYSSAPYSAWRVGIDYVVSGPGNTILTFDASIPPFSVGQTLSITYAS